MLSNPPVILVVHGVQTGEDADQQQDKAIKALVDAKLDGFAFDYDVQLYRYENINDDAVAKFKVLSQLIAKTPVHSVLASAAIELVGDVVISLSNASTATKIRQGLTQKILEIHQAQRPVYLVAHSLGSIYAFDVLNKLIAKKEYFDRNNLESWPVMGLVTIGSPIGLAMFKKGSRKSAKRMGEGRFPFRWINYFDVTDPIVSGNIFGKKLTNIKIAEQFKQGSKDFGWFIQDYPIDTGKYWLLSHVAYWENGAVGNGIVNMVLNV